MKRLFCFLILLNLYSGCDEATFVQYKNPPKQPVTEKRVDLSAFIAPGVDILFVVDNSGSMGTIQENIVINSKTFMDKFSKSALINWRLGVVSTDRNQAPYLGFDSIFDNSNQSPVQTFQNAIRSLGVNGDASEYVFYNGLRHITDSNFSFLRRNAHLAIVMVTDEPEQSRRRFGAQYEPLTYINTMKALKDPTKIVRFYGAFNFTDLEDCDSWGSDTYKNSPFEEVISETGGIYMSACTDDFGLKLAEIGRDIASLVDFPTVTLNTRPKIETIEVSYRGEVLPGGDREDGAVWFYDKYFNTITFYTLDFVDDELDLNVDIKFDIQDGVDRR